MIKSQSGYEQASKLTKELDAQSTKLTKDQKEFLTLLRHLIGRYEEKTPTLSIFSKSWLMNTS